MNPTTTTIKCHLSEDFLWCILQRISNSTAYIPPELKRLISDYWFVTRFTNLSIREAVLTWYRQRGEAMIKYGHISLWDTSRVTNMRGLFHGMESFNDNIESWDVSHVVNMEVMFYCFNRSEFNQPLNSWEVSQVRRMRNMFAGARNFNQPLNHWDVSQVQYMCEMFADAYAFNQPLNNWNTSNVEDMTSMFRNARSFNQPLYSWDVSKVTSVQCMFNGATSFNQPSLIESWNLPPDASRVCIFHF